MKIRTLQLAAIMAAGLVGAWSASATVSVTLDSVSPNQIVVVNGSSAYAGVYNLTVGGIGAVPSFCIDVAHGFDVGQTFNGFSTVPLASAPNSPAGPMGASAANTIEGLWGTYYTPGIGASDAAALQVAIWMAVDGGNNPGSVPLVFGADATTQAAVTEANTMLGSISTYAQLYGLVGTATPNGDSQSFVVPVPEPTTVIAGLLLLLPLGASTLRIIRRNRMA